jgi:hypothetical protein
MVSIGKLPHAPNVSYSHLTSLIKLRRPAITKLPFNGYARWCHVRSGHAPCVDWARFRMNATCSSTAHTLHQLAFNWPTSGDEGHVHQPHHSRPIPCLICALLCHYRRWHATLVLHMAVPGLRLFLFVAFLECHVDRAPIRLIVLGGMGTQLVTPLQSGQVSSTHRLLYVPRMCQRM